MKRMTIAEYSDKLRVMRGKRYQRTLTDEDLMQCLEEARTFNYGHRCGVSVANCYGWRAYRMRMVAIRMSKGRGYAVLTTWGSAKRDSSTVPEGGTLYAFEVKVPAMKKGTLKSVVDAGYSILSEAEVHRVLARRRLDAATKAAAQWPDKDDYKFITVTVRDSIDAGNCVAQTNRVASWFPNRTEITATELRTAILNREPTLTRYAMAAVTRAQEKK